MPACLNAHRLSPLPAAFCCISGFRDNTDAHWVLSRRFYPDLHWYVDVMLTLIERAAEYATRDVWHSVVQLITNFPDLHQYAAEKVSKWSTK